MYNKITKSLLDFIFCENNFSYIGTYICKCKINIIEMST